MGRQPGGVISPEQWPQLELEGGGGVSFCWEVFERGPALYVLLRAERADVDLQRRQLVANS